MNKKDRVIGCLILLILAILIVLYIASHMGGSSSGPAPLQIKSTGGVRGTSGQGPNNPVGPKTYPLLQQVTTSGGTVSGYLPVGESIPANGYVGVVSSPTPVIGGIGVGTSGGSATNPAGTVLVDGAASGVTVNTSGALTGSILLTPGYHSITMYGPFTLSGSLNISSSITFGVTVTSQGSITLPTSEMYSLPSNSQDWVAVDGINFSNYPTNFVGWPATILVVEPPSGTSSGYTLQVNGAVSSSGAVILTNLDPNGTDPVPSTGIQSIEIDVTQPNSNQKTN